jgi:hypothetical protein
MTYEEATTILEAFTAGIAGLEDAASPDAGAPGLQKPSTLAEERGYLARRCELPSRRGVSGDRLLLAPTRLLLAQTLV